ncbi:hypothetical protein BJX63DRAFT_430054 [Aspergillus granulosus]|uniref:Uncharacterized protein n=1 Tax=Aspergillus granulosus TaxID=176169 RepID=A0ABR4HME6_9EURO
MIFHIGNGWLLKEPIQSGVSGRVHLNQPMNLDIPILDILQSVKGRGKFQYSGRGDREVWVREIDRAALGYLQLESERREAGFELEALAELE